ncbi:coiled-coil domain-containing protein 115 [Aplochiton taeniatus]
MGLAGNEGDVLIDDKLLRFMDQLELLEEKRDRLNTLIEQGWFTMTKARYSMGNKQVSALQYGNEMEPLVNVHTRALENGETEFHVERMVQSCPDDINKYSSPVEDIGPKEEGVRRRTKNIHLAQNERTNESSKTGLTAGVDTSVSKSDHNPQQDPLRWFGILVPQSLKQSQSSFRQVIDLSAEIATLQCSVLITRNELHLEMKHKHSVLDRNAMKL